MGFRFGRVCLSPHVSKAQYDSITADIRMLYTVEKRIALQVGLESTTKRIFSNMKTSG